MKSVLILATAFLVSLASARQSNAPVRLLQIQEIRPLEGNDGINVYGINNAGLVVGCSAKVLAPDGAIDHKAWWWSNGATHQLPSLTKERAYAFAVNNAGDIAGCSHGQHDELIPTIWPHGDYDHPTRLTGRGAINSINDKGDAVGENMWGPEAEAVVWSGGTRKILESGMRQYSSKANCINQNGMIVGENLVAATGFGNMVPHGPTRAFLWNNGKRWTLDAISGETAVAKYVNDSGVVVGSSEYPVKGPLSYSHACYWKDGRVHELGGDALDSDALAINNRGIIVGRYLPKDTGFRACIWKDGRFVDLGALLPKETGWTLMQATGINDRNQIVGIGYHKRPGLKEPVSIDVETGIPEEELGFVITVGD